MYRAWVELSEWERNLSSSVCTDEGNECTNERINEQDILVNCWSSHILEYLQPHRKSIREKRSTNNMCMREEICKLYSTYFKTTLLCFLVAISLYSFPMYLKYNVIIEWVRLSVRIQYVSLSLFPYLLSS